MMASLRLTGIVQVFCCGWIECGGPSLFVTQCNGLDIAESEE